jgi:hypothetical protein
MSELIRAYDAGRKARAENKPVTANPYEKEDNPNQTLHSQWYNGWGYENSLRPAPVVPRTPAPAPVNPFPPDRERHIPKPDSGLE